MRLLHQVVPDPPPRSTTRCCGRSARDRLGSDVDALRPYCEGHKSVAGPAWICGCSGSIEETTGGTGSAARSEETEALGDAVGAFVHGPSTLRSSPSRPQRCRFPLRHNSAPARLRLGQLGHLLGARTLYTVSEQLCKLRGCAEDFGGIPIVLFCEDFRPVQDCPSPACSRSAQP